MALVRVKKGGSISYQGVLYTPEAEPFEMDSETARAIPQLVELVGAPKPKRVSVNEPPPVSTTISDLASASPALVSVLIKGGFTTVEKIALATVDDLTVLKGIGKATAKKLKSEARDLLKG